MLKTLIIVPARIGLGAVRVSLLVTARMLEVAGEVAEALIRQREETAPRHSASLAAEREPGREGSVGERKPPAPRPKPAPRRKPAPKRAPAPDREPAPEREPAAEREPAEEREPPPPPAATAPPPPPHVSSEPTLVEEVADPGAQDGAGAQVRVDAPWEGYDRLAAKEVIDRLSSADAAELAAVELYELSGRQRKSVLEAVQRELRRAQGSG
jgi:outer membrane biosynthesis protein TonB